MSLKREQKRIDDLISNDFENIIDAKGKITPFDTRRDEAHLKAFKQNPYREKYLLRKTKKSKSKSKRK